MSRTGVDQSVRDTGPTHPSNWRNPRERQRVTVASSWDAVHELCFEMPDGPLRAYSPTILPSGNVWHDQQATLRERLHCFRGTDAVRAAHHLFHEHGGRVICVLIHNGQLRFVPMVNPEWRNDWPERPPGELDAHFRRKHSHVRGQLPPQVLPFHTWWSAGHLLCNRPNPEPYAMSDRSLVAVRHMLETVIAANPALVPDCCFFLNIRDGAMIRRDGQRPCPLPWRPPMHPRACAPDALPVFGFNGSIHHFDVACPTDADWLRATQCRTLGAAVPTLPNVRLAFEDKRPVAVWRGSLTGPGNTAGANPRLALLSVRSPWVDAKCTSTNHERCRVCPLSQRVCSIDPTPHGNVRANFIPYHIQQENYMAQVVVAGHAEAHRWPAALAGNQVVVRVQSEHRMWIDDVALPGEHYLRAHTPHDVPAVVSAALSDVPRARQLARAAQDLSQRWTTVRGIVDWWHMALGALPASCRRYTE